MDNLKEENSNSSIEQITSYKNMFTYFNRRLFAGKLPDCYLNFSRENKDIVGFFAPKRWTNKDKIIHEISLNPRRLSLMKKSECIYALIHEMCHLWQYEFGKISRNGYHNKQFAAKISYIGLMPTSTGDKNGKNTGQIIYHYLINGGRLENAMLEMPKNYFLPWGCLEADLFYCYKNDLKIDKLKSEMKITNNDDTTKKNIEEKNQRAIEEKKEIKKILKEYKKDIKEVLKDSNNIGIKFNTKNKIKYTCPNCKINVWGKGNIKIKCENCNKKFEEQK